MEPLFALINGASCRYVVSGSGEKTLVLVHELAGSLNSWDDLVPLLPGSVRVLRHDLRGAGQSEKVRGRLDLDTLADDISALLDHLEIAGTVDLMGAAAGASVAVRFATRHPSRAGRIVLLAPALGVPAERREAALATADLLDTEGMRAIADAVLSKALPDDLWASEEARATAMARWFGADPEGYAALYRAIAEDGVIGELGAVACPALLLAGARDPFNSPEKLREISQCIPNCQFEVIDAGHFIAVQSPQALPKIVMEFLTR
jgi:3-oxoadipate enol-lactonase